MVWRGISRPALRGAWNDVRMKLLVCGGAGFIGSTFVRLRLLEHGDEVTVLDKLTYAGREENFNDFAEHPRFRFLRGGIEDAVAVAAAIEAGSPEAIVNFAAETHVDRSIAEPDAFVTTHALGTYVLLEAARARALRRAPSQSSLRCVPPRPIRRPRPVQTCSSKATFTPTRCPSSSAAGRTTTAPTSIPRSSSR